jgi:NAD(P)-dependent dehydrogenase (short-subunit alcohol dehydrogenase family)
MTVPATGRVAGVTGAGSGIGLGVARDLASRGQAVTCAHLRSEEAGFVSGQVLGANGGLHPGS